MDTPIESSDFIRDVTALGDSCEVIAREDIWSSKRIKLLEAGSRIDSRLFERLSAHRLQVPIENSLSTADAVDGKRLAASARQLVESHPLYCRIAKTNGATDAICDALMRAPMPAPLGFVLTVMRETRPDLFEHSLKVAVLALHLAFVTGVPKDLQAALATAGVAHDIGTLHIDPALLSPGRRLEAAERRHVYVHPVTAQMMLQGYGGVPDAARVAVLEHHERLDGTGYPRGVAGSAISALGNMLMVCEIVAVIFERHGPERGSFELPVLLKLSRRKFDRVLVDRLIAFLGSGGAGAPPDAGSEIARTAASQRAIAAALAQWTALRDSLMATEQGVGIGTVVQMIDQRVSELTRSVLETGVSLLEPPDPATWADDGAATGEMTLLAREAAWQLREAINEVRRRYGDCLAHAGDAAQRVVAWLASAEAGIAGPDESD